MDHVHPAPERPSVIDLCTIFHFLWVLLIEISLCSNSNSAISAHRGHVSSGYPGCEMATPGVTTYAPWFSKAVCPKPSRFRQMLTEMLHKDLEAMKKLSWACHTQDQMYSPVHPMVVKLTYGARNAQALVGLTLKIQDALSKGCTVVMHGLEPSPPLDFSLEVIQMYHPMLSQLMVVQSKWSLLFTMNT